MTLSIKYFRLPKQSDQALYQQIQDNLIELIDNNLLEAGDMLPSERQLSDAYGVNRMTVRQAIDGLVQKGLVEKKPGAGTLITDNRAVQAFTPTVIGFSQRMRDAGMQPSSRILQRDVIAPDPIIAHHLNLDVDAPVVMIKRLRLANDEPLMIETSYLSQAMFASLLDDDLENESLYGIIEQRYGLRVVETEHTLEPILANAFEAHHLGIGIHTPAMLVRVVAYGADRIPIEMSKSIVRGDRCRYFFRVNTKLPIIQ
ncbi:MAG: GntR family transcriptional regulator [Anaerolineae bacterium]